MLYAIAMGQIINGEHPAWPIGAWYLSIYMYLLALSDDCCMKNIECTVTTVTTKSRIPR